MPLKDRSDLLLLDVPDLPTVRGAQVKSMSVDNSMRHTDATHPDLAVFRACCEVLSVRAEAQAPDVQVSQPRGLFVSKDAGSRGEVALANSVMSVW